MVAEERRCTPIERAAYVGGCRGLREDAESRSPGNGSHNEVQTISASLDVDNVYTVLDNLHVILWDEIKDAKLREERGVSFEDVVERIASSEVLDILEHHARRNQKVFVIALKGRIHAVPFLSDEDGNVVLKTIYPSRKLERRYGKKQKQNQA